MEFKTRLLQQTESPDPFWLHKLGNALIKQDAEKRAKASGDDVALEVHAITESIKAYLKSGPATRHLQETPFDPLVEALTEQWCQFSDTFYLTARRHPFNNISEWSEADRRAAFSAIRDDVIKAYHDLSLISHIENVTGASTDRAERIVGPIVETLDKWGGNGFGRMFNHWQQEKGNLLELIQADERIITPTKLGLTHNRSSTKVARKDHFRNEMYSALNHKNAEDHAVVDEALMKAIPRTIGPVFEEAQKSFEDIVSRHLSSGTIEFGDPMLVTAAALHRNNERLQDAAVKAHKTDGLMYVDASLNLSPQEIELIRAGALARSVNEMLDEAFIGDMRGAGGEQIKALVGQLYILHQPPQHDTGEDISHEIPVFSGQEFLDMLQQWTSVQDFQGEIDKRLAGAHIIEGKVVDAQEKGSPTEHREGRKPLPPPPKEDKREHATGERTPLITQDKAQSEDRLLVKDTPEDKEDSKSDGKAFAVKAGGTILGSILIADQIRRANRKDSNDDETAPKQEKSSKMLNYVLAAIAAAGVGVLLFTKPEKLTKFVSSLTRLDKAPQR